MGLTMPKSNNLVNHFSLLLDEVHYKNRNPWNSTIQTYCFERLMCMEYKISLCSKNNSFEYVFLSPTPKFCSVEISRHRVKGKISFSTGSPKIFQILNSFIKLIVHSILLKIGKINDDFLRFFNFVNQITLTHMEETHGTMEARKCAIFIDYMMWWWFYWYCNIMFLHTNTNITLANLVLTVLVRHLIYCITNPKKK